MAEKTNTISIKIPNSSFYYKDDFNSNWVNENPMVYATDIAIENFFADILKFPLDRIIYASNDFSMREREKKNDGNLNLPYMSYYKVGYSDCDREWFNNWGNLQYPLSDDNQIVQLGQKIKVFPIKIEYEGVVVFSQSKDCEHAYRNLAYESSNESIVYPIVETSNDDTVKNIGIVYLDLEYNPTYNENDWLERNKIFTIGVDFSVDTFMFVGDLSPLHIAKEVEFDFIASKNLNPDNIYENAIVLSNYFGENS